MPATENGHDGSETPKPVTNAGLQGAIRFVVIFLVCTAVLLTAGRYAVGTKPMNDYLYFVAKHTSIVLGLFTYSSGLEESAVHRANAAGIRSSLTAWAEGEYAPDAMLMETDPGAPPLTAYESWMFRIGRLKQDIRMEREAIAELDAVTLPPGGNAEDRLQQLKADVATLQRSAKRQGPNGPIQMAYAQFAKELSEIDRAIREGPGAERNSFTEGVADLEVDVRNVRDQQFAFLDERLRRLEKRMQSETGPLVSLTLTAGLKRKLEDARAALAERESATGQADEALRAEIEALQTERAEAEPQVLAKLDKDVSFRFSVVPDCGALPSMAIFVSAMIAFPARWWKRLVGIAAGVPLLYAVNVFRLVCLGVIGAYYDGGEEFDFAHHYVWQGIYIVFVVAIWMLWVELMVKPRRDARPAAA